MDTTDRVGGVWGEMDEIQPSQEQGEEHKELLDSSS